MTKTEVIRNRGFLTKYNCVGKLICDNECVYYTVNNNSKYFKWDDTNECFYILANSEIPIAQVMGKPSGPVNQMVKELSIVPYEGIQEFVMQIPVQSIQKFLTEDMGETEENATKIFSGFSDDFRY